MHRRERSAFMSVIRSRVYAGGQPSGAYSRQLWKRSPGNVCDDIDGSDVVLAGPCWLLDACWSPTIVPHRYMQSESGKGCPQHTSIVRPSAVLPTMSSSLRYTRCTTGRSSTPNVEGLPDLADLPDLVIPDVDSCTGNDTVLYTIYWRNYTVSMLSDVFINLEILNTPLILVIMLLQDNNIFKKLTSGIMDSLTGFQDNLVQSWWPDFPTGVAGHWGGGTSV